MKKTSGLLLAFLLHGTIQVGAQRVGIGTTSPLARLAVDSGILIDQSNLNQGNLIAGALQFGSNGLVGIARSTVAGSIARSGIGFYTGGSRRMLIDSTGDIYMTGNIGVGISNPLYDIHTSGSARIGSYLGVNADPGTPYRLRVNGDAYFENSNVGIGIAPSTSYALYAAGSVRVTTDVRIDGILNPSNPLAIGNSVTVEGSLSVGGRGIVRGSGSGQWRLVRLTVGYCCGVPANGDVVGAALAFNLSGATLAGIFVGPIVEEGSGSSNLQNLGLVPTDISSTGCRFLIMNGSGSDANMGSSANPTRWQLTLLVFE